MVEEMKRRGWTKRDLARQRKGDPTKVALTRRLLAQFVIGSDSGQSWPYGISHLQKAIPARDCMPFFLPCSCFDLFEILGKLRLVGKIIYPAAQPTA